MSEENVETIRRFLAAWNRGDLDAALAHFEPAWKVGPRPDRRWAAWLAAWEPMEIWDYDLRDAGESVVALISGQLNRGRHSGVEVEVTPYALVFTLRNRKVVRWTFYSDQAEALEAAGLLE